MACDCCISGDHAQCVIDMNIDRRQKGKPKIRTCCCSKFTLSSDELNELMLCVGVREDGK